MESVTLIKRFFWKLLAFKLAIAFNISAVGQVDETAGKRIDSLKQALATSAGQNKYDILDKLAYEYVFVVDSIALLYATDAFKMSWQYGDSSRIVKTGRVKAMALNALSKFDSTITLSRKILPMARRNSYTNEIERILNLLLLAHTHKAEYDKALTYGFESLELRKKQGDSLSVSVALNNVGLVYYKLDNFVQALDYYKQSLLLRPNKDKYYLTTSFINISLCYSFLNNQVLAEQYFNKANEMFAKGLDDTRLANLHYAAGVLQFNYGNMQKASESLLKALFIVRNLSDQQGELEALSFLARISIRLNDFTQAEKYLLQAEPLFEKDIPFKLELINVYKQLANVYTKMGNYLKTSHFQSKYIDLKEKVYNSQLTINLMKVQAEYQERENNAKIKAQAKILALSNEGIKKQRTLNMGVILIVLLLSGYLIIVMQYAKRKKHANELLEQKVKERTMELELNHNLLLKSFHERDVQFQRMSTEVKSSLATIKGLGVLVSHDVNTVSGSNYLEKIEEASNSLIRGLNRVYTNDFL